MISVLISPAGKFPEQQTKARQIIFSFLTKEKINGVEVSLKFADKQEIRRLNKRYRGLDKPTTVLTFSQQEEKEGQAFPKPLKNWQVLGDIIICLEEAKKKNLSLEQLLIHGLKNLIKTNEQRPGLLSQIPTSKNL